ncbi:MAG: N-acetyltransferase [Chloroflexi bacterium]|nr:MAG: N-acetyltransferase [Chloroflexota bacterium]
MDFKIIERLPTLPEYYQLCKAVGWEEVINFEAAHKAISNSTYAIIAESNGKTIGMGRIVGDGAIFFYIQDIAVDPEYQGNGVGKAIMNHLISWTHEHAPPQAFVALFAAKGTIPFYQQHGFAQHEGLTGIFQVIPK